MLPKDCPTCQENHSPEDLAEISAWLQKSVDCLTECLEITKRNTIRLGELQSKADKQAAAHEELNENVQNLALRSSEMLAGAWLKAEGMQRDLAETVSSLAMAFGQVVKDRHVKQPSVEPGSLGKPARWRGTGETWGESSDPLTEEPETEERAPAL